MSIEIQALEVHALADTLLGVAEEAHDIGNRPDSTARVGGGLQPTVEAFLDTYRTAGRALAGELSWLASTVAAVADSWARLDASLVAPAGGRPPA